MANSDNYWQEISDLTIFKQTRILKSDWLTWYCGSGYYKPQYCTTQSSNAAQPNLSATSLISTVNIQQPAPEDLETLSINEDAQGDDIAELAKLFDPVTVNALEKMFPSHIDMSMGKWKSWSERAARNGLSSAREGLSRYNPYKAAMWFLSQGIDGWDLAHCNRVLAKNLPARSRDYA
jgi:hypothetical protein